MSIFSQYIGVKNIYKRYWDLYGGYRSLLKSPYFQISFFLTLLMYDNWMSQGWWNDVIEIIPSILGFSLGGYAIMLAFGDDDFRSLLSMAYREKKKSAFLSINASFLHFILLQSYALILAIIAKAQPLKNLSQNIKTNILTFLNLSSVNLEYVTLSLWFLSYFVFIYAILSAISAVFAVFRIATWYDTYIKKLAIRQQDYIDEDIIEILKVLSNQNNIPFKDLKDAYFKLDKSIDLIQETIKLSKNSKKPFAETVDALIESDSNEA